MWKFLEMAKEYFRLWRLRPDAQGLESPNMADDLFVQPPPPPPPPPGIPARVRLTRAKARSVFIVNPPVEDDFVLRQDEPVVIGDPKFPSAGTNVGVTGTYTQVLAGARTLRTGESYKNVRFKGFVTLAGASFEDCLFEAGAAPLSVSGYVTAISGISTLIRCTIMPETPDNVRYWVNALKVTGGTVNTFRCHLILGVDGFRIGGGTVNDQGSLVSRMVFVYPDNDHPPGSTSGSPNYWVHPDCAQFTAGGKHSFIGTSFKGVCDASGVDWSGGSWGVGLAQRTSAAYGQPQIALNPYNASTNPNNPRAYGFKRTTQPDELLWGNCITQSGSGSLDLTLEDCWVDGATWGSAIVQFTSGSGHKIRLRRVKVRLGGWPSDTGKYGLFRWPSGTVLDVLNSGADASARYDNHPSVPVGLRGSIINIGATGASVTV